MATAIKIKCCDECTGCQAMGMTEEEYRQVVGTYRNSPHKEARELASKILNVESVRIFCKLRQEVLMVNVMS